ncbi:hypothetical protein VNO80_22599 [Phaseolus coccineus]|uniref:Uncharacterized protein n=1 Tax=Phaseolus coccineus TaxID=3886 RepID=A0AAN9QRW9_PHACN
MVPLSQLQQQKQHVGGQNSHVLQNLNSEMGIGMRSGLLQKSFTNSNGAINNAYGLIGNNIQLANEPGTSSDNYASTYANSPKHLHQHFDQNQKPVVQGNIFLTPFNFILSRNEPTTFTCNPAPVLSFITFFALGDIYVQLGQTDKGQDFIRRATKIDPGMSR